MTLWELYSEGKDILTQAGVDDAPLDARLLLLEAFSLDMNGYLKERQSEIIPGEASDTNTARYREMISKRAERIPLQRIIGSTEFMGLEFSVKENVLIPRQDTETLAEKVLDDRAQARAGFKDPAAEDSLLDLCAGSGCIGLSLAVKGNFSRVVLTDISKEALDAARENAARLHLQGIGFYQGDLFSALPRGTRPFSVITVNPPYIPTAKIAELEPEVRDHEPKLALDGSENGLLFYRRIAAEAPPYLTDEGRIYMEIGFDQGPAVREIFESAGFAGVEIFKDLSGCDRVAAAMRPED